MVSVGGLAGGKVPGTPLVSSTPIEISLSLAGSHPTGLGQVIQQEGTPGSALFGQTLAPSTYTQSYGPDGALVSSLDSYLATQGLTTSRTGNLLLVKGTAGQMENAFATSLNMYHPTNGVQYWAPLVAPTLPSSVAPVVSSIMGLNTLARPENFQILPAGIGSSPVAPSAPTAQRPHAAIQVVLSTASFSFSGTTGLTFDPPAGMNVTFTATATIPTNDTCAPCIFRWIFGDGKLQVDTVNSAVDSLGHTYLQANNQFSTAALMRVNVSDTQVQYGQGSASIVPTMSPAWMETAYGERPLFAKGDSGQGSIVGLDEMCDSTFDTGTTVYTSALDTFSTTMGLPVPSVNYIGNGTSCPSGDGISGWSTETMLDMEWAHVMAPNATLQVYFGQNNQGVDIAGGDATWANPTAGVFVASNSWGIPELSAVPGPGTPGPFDSTWSQAAAQGVTLFSSSGDCGGTDNLSSVPSNGYNVSYPADNPDGIGVGGTILQTDTSGNFANEYTWNSTAYLKGTACTNNNYGTGGGWSQDYSAPQYQQGVTGAGWAPPTKWPVAGPRGVPDVAMDAATWVDIYYPGDASLGYPAVWVYSGGTSLASPMWAATTAVVLQSLNRHYNTSAPGFLNYPFYTIGKSAAYAVSFHDVTLGNNRDPFGYSAATGWDPTTGWGSPNAVGLAGGLAWALPVRYPVSGIVSDATTHAPIAGATVTASGGQGVTLTAANGSYTLYIPNGTYTLTATATGYNPNTLAVTMVGLPLRNQNILLYSRSLGNSQTITGILITQTQVPLQGGSITATGTMVASAATGPGGHFTLYLLNGSYTLTGSILILQPWINPALNSTTMALTVNGPVSGLVVTLYYALHTITGQVLSEATGQSLAGASITGFDLIPVSATANAQGRFYLQLPTGAASITAAASMFLNATVSTFVNENGTATVSIYLLPAHISPNQFTVALRVVAPLNATLGIPEVKGQGSVGVDIWANNSTTASPQQGLRIALGTTLGGNFSTFSTSIPSSGMAMVQYNAPYVTANLVGSIFASVSSLGDEGTASTSLQVLTDVSGCGNGCSYLIDGRVLSNAGTGIKGATVYLKDSIGKSTLTQATTSISGAYSFSEPVGSYTITATASGYQSTGLVHFSVTKGPVDLSPIVLNPNSKATGSGNDFLSYTTLITEILLGAVLVLTVYILWRRLKNPPSKKEEGPSGGSAAPIDVEAEIFSSFPPPEESSPASLPPPPTSGEPSGSSPPSEPALPAPPEQPLAGDTGNTRAT